jgi:hypothetical protein
MAVDIQKWLRENMEALKLSDEEKAMAEKLATGTFGKTLGAAVYPQQSVSDLQSRLDKEAQQRKEVEEANIAWQDTYYRDVSELGAIDKLKAAGFDVSGLEQTRGGGVVHQQTGQQLTAEQIGVLIQKEAQRLIDPVRQTTLEFAEFVSTVAPDYRESFGKRFEAKKFREFAFEHRNEFANLQQAYDAYTADDRKVNEENAKKKWEADKEKEIEMRVMSRMQIPEYAPETGSGGPFDVAKSAPAAAASSSTDSSGAAAAGPTREQNRQEFAKKFSGSDFTGL